MTTNLGKLLQALNVLDEAAGLAPLNRHSHCAVQQAVNELRTALPELWQAATGKGESGKQKAETSSQSPG